MNIESGIIINEREDGSMVIAHQIGVGFTVSDMFQDEKDRCIKQAKHKIHEELYREIRNNLQEFKNNFLRRFPYQPDHPLFHELQKIINKLEYDG
jgi:hypothetical protein